MLTRLSDLYMHSQVATGRLRKRAGSVGKHVLRRLGSESATQGGSHDQSTVSLHTSPSCGTGHSEQPCGISPLMRETFQHWFNILCWIYDHPALVIAGGKADSRSLQDLEDCLTKAFQYSIILMHIFIIFHGKHFLKLDPYIQCAM